MVGSSLSRGRDPASEFEVDRERGKYPQSGREKHWFRRAAEQVSAARGRSTTDQIFHSFYGIGLDRWENRFSLMRLRYGILEHR